MQPAEPNCDRQLSDREPIFLWRDSAAGGREGLALLPRCCANPECSCREMSVEARAVTAALIGVAADDGHVSIVHPRDAPNEGRCVLQAQVDIDTGAVAPDDDAPVSQRDAGALAWLRAELREGGPLLDCLRRLFRIDKGLAVTPPAARRFNWKRWKPGERVFWEEVFPEAAPTEPVAVAGRMLAIREFYCANPRCDCDEVILYLHQPGGDRRLLGSVTVEARAGELRELKVAGDEGAAALLAEAWARLKARHEVPTYYCRRRAAVQWAASDGTRRGRPAPAAPPTEEKTGIPRNAPCPCGSGLKYKRCCLSKRDAPR